MYDNDPFSPEQKERELLKRYPEMQSHIKKAMEFNREAMRESEMTIPEFSLNIALQEREKVSKMYEDKKIVRVQNLSYEQQKKI